MRLHVTMPPAWKPRTFGTRVLVEIEPGLEIEIAPIAPLPEDVVAWSSSIPHRDTTGGVTKVDVTTTYAARSDLDWPLIVHESRGLDASGIERQSRIHVLFVLVEHCAMVAIRDSDAVRFAARREELLAIVRTGRPEWGLPTGASLEDLLAT